MKLGRPLIAIVTLALLVAVPMSSSADGARRVSELRIDGVINAFTADYIVGGLQQADKDQVDAVVITMDTPGGIDTSMRKIIQAILTAPQPVILYVSPSGARAASAGLYISQAADVIAMAPGTNIGSAHPVFLNTGTGATPSNTDVEAQKVLNDSVAYIQGLANLHKRNADWAADAVRNSANVTAEEAARLHVIDLVGPDLSSLLRAIDGRQVSKSSHTLTLHTAAAGVEAHPMGFWQGLLHAIADPEIAYLLLLLAILGIGFEVTHPGVVLPGVVGVIAGITALVAFETLPVNYAGFVLIAFGLALLVADIKAPTHGVLTAGGIISLGVGSFMVMDAGAPYLEPNVWLAVFPPLVLGLVLAFLISRAVAARRLRPTTGSERLVGAIGQARDDLGPAGGLVMVDGALWQAHSSAPISRGSQVRVKSIEGLKLEVEPG
jgi:membrane-bound serine protease (ClpP class)